MYNSNWARWIQASVATHMKVAAGIAGYPALIEGIDERTTAFMESPNRVEIRINGPFITEKTQNEFYFEVGLNLLLFSYMGGRTPNAYDGIAMAGVMAKACEGPIAVYKYGTGVADDQTQIGCLVVNHDKGSGIKVFHFGEIDRDNRLRQFAVDVELEMCL